MFVEYRGVRTAYLLIVLAGTLRPRGLAEWLDVPYVRQSRDGCGPASIAMVMQYWNRTHRDLDPAAAVDTLIYTRLAGPDRNGIPGQKLKGYLEENGYEAHVFRGELSDLRDNLQKGRPLVVCLAPRGRRSPLHYVVVVGVSNKKVLFHDPSRGKLIEQDISRFSLQWQFTDYWTLLATPRGAP